MAHSMAQPTDHHRGGDQSSPLIPPQPARKPLATIVARVAAAAAAGATSPTAARETRESAARQAALHGVVPADTSTRIRGHNFAIQLLRVLEGSMDDILLDFAREAGLLPRYESAAATYSSSDNSDGDGDGAMPLPEAPVVLSAPGSPPKRSPQRSPASPVPGVPFPASFASVQHQPTATTVTPLNAVGSFSVSQAAASPKTAGDLSLRTSAAASPASRALTRNERRKRKQEAERRAKLAAYKSAAAVPRRAFVRIMAARVEAAVQDDSSSSPRHNRVRSLAPTAISPGHAVPSTTSATTTNAPAPSTYTWFECVDAESVKEELGYVFDAADAGSTGRVNFNTIMAYIVDCALQGDVGYVAEAIPYYGSKGVHFLQGMDEITMARYCSELGKTLTAGKHIGIVDAVASQTFVLEYPKPAAFKNAALLIAAGGKHVVNATTAVYSVDYVPHLEAAIVAGTDRGLHLIDVSTAESLFFIKTPEPVTLLAYDRPSHTVVTTSRTLYIRCFKMSPHRHTDSKYEVSHVMREHTNTITHIASLNRDGLVATAGLDGRVVVWDVSIGTVFTRFTGHTGQPICSMQYVSSFGYMASCSIHSEPKVWIVSAMASRSDCFRLCDTETPHTDRVVALADVPQSPQLLSMDRNGMIKVWDLRTFLCVQTIRTERAGHGQVRATTQHWHSLVYDAAAGVMVAVSGRRLQAFCPIKVADGIGKKDGTTEAVAGSNEHYTLSTDLATAALSRTDIDRQHKAQAAVEQLKRQVEAAARGGRGGMAAGRTLGDDGDDGETRMSSISRQAAKADDFPIVALSLNLVNATCVTASDRKVRVWDVFTGKLEARFDRLAGLGKDSARISAVCVATSGRCFFLGFRSGRLAVHAYSTGALLHTLVEAGDGAEITRLTYLHGTSAFIASSWDGCKMYYDRPRYDEGINSFWPDDTRGYAARAVAFDPLLSLLAVGYAGGEVRLHEGRRHRFTPGSVRHVATYNGFTAHDIDSVCLMQGFPAMAVADGVGQVFLVTTPPHAFAGRVFARLSLRQRTVCRMAFIPSRRVLYLGTDVGTVLAVEADPALRTVNLRQPAGSWEALMSGAGRSGAQPRWVEELKPRRAIQAHSDAVVELVTVPGAGLLLTASADRAVLAWTGGLFFRGELDNTATFGRYVATAARPVHPATTGMQAYAEQATGFLGVGFAAVVDQASAAASNNSKHAQPSRTGQRGNKNPKSAAGDEASAHDVALQVAASLAAELVDDDWAHIPIPFAGDGDDSDDAEGSAHDGDMAESEIATAAVTPARGRSARQSPGLSTMKPLPHHQAASGDLHLPLLTADGAAGASASLSLTRPRRSSPPGGGHGPTAGAEAAAGTMARNGSPHYAVLSVARLVPHPIVGPKRQRITNENAIAIDNVVESAADDEAAQMYRDVLQSFLPSDVRDAMNRRGQMAPEDTLREEAKAKRSPTRSTAKAAALLIDAPVPVLNPDIPSDLPSTATRHDTPALALAPPLLATAATMSTSQTNAHDHAVAKGIEQEAAAARTTTLSCNSCGVDFHTVFSFGPSDPNKRLPKAFVVETAESAGAEGGEDFVVTQDRPNPPHAREIRDYEIKRIMDHEDAQQETVEAARRLEEATEALARENTLANMEILTSHKSGSFHRGANGGTSHPKGATSFTTDDPLELTTSTEIRRTLSGASMLSTSQARALPSTAPTHEDATGGIDWGPTAGLDDPPHRAMAGNRTPTPSLFGSVLPDHLSPVAALRASLRDHRAKEAHAEANKLAKRMVPAELLRLREVQTRGAKRPDGGLAQLIQRARVMDLERRATTPGLPSLHPASSLPHRSVTPAAAAAPSPPPASLDPPRTTPSMPRLNGAAARPDLPAPAAGHYTTFARCVPIADSLPRQRPMTGVEPPARLAATTSEGVAPDADIEGGIPAFRLDTPPSATTPLPDVSQRRHVGTRAAQRPRPGGVADVGFKALERQLQSGADQVSNLGFTTLGVRQIPLATLNALGGDERRPATSASPAFPAIAESPTTIDPAALHQDSKKRRQIGTPILWSRTHRV
jgi:WD40 repeat protein